MTREEAVQRLVAHKLWHQDEFVDFTGTIDAIDMAIEALQENESLAKSVNDAAELIHKLQKTGKWEWVQLFPSVPYDSNSELGNWHCSECGFIPASFNLAKKHLNYCPNCGSDMRGEEE